MMNYVIVGIFAIAILISIYLGFVGHQRSFKTIQKLHINRIDHERNDFIYVIEDNRTNHVDEKLVYSGITWGEFVDVPKMNISNQYSLDFRKIDGLIKCPSKQTVVKTSSNLSSPCLREMDSQFLLDWNHHIQQDYCEKEAPSKIRCYDSPNKSKYCIFENVMMNFRKMRRRNSEDGNSQRMWERGFLASDCGFQSKDEIEGYFSQYKPDIDGQNDAICDYVFTEPVVAYSHDNIKHLGHSMNDILNVWSMLWMTNHSRHLRDVTFLNIDGFRKGKVYDDNLMQFTSHYKPFFKRILGISQFLPSKKVCFKELIFFPKPLLLFIGDRSRHSDIGSSTLPLPCHPHIESITNPLFQRWNLHFRSALRKYYLKTAPVKIFRIMLLRKLSPATSIVNYDASFFHNETQLFFRDLSIALKEIGISKLGRYDKTVIEEVDISTISLQQQVRVIAKSHVLIGLHGSGINALSIHMPIGTVDCCSVVEIFDHGNMRPVVPGIRNAAQAMGHRYTRMEVALHHHSDHNNHHDMTSNSDNQHIRNRDNDARRVRRDEIKKVLKVVESSISYTATSPTCVLPEALVSLPIPIN